MAFVTRDGVRLYYEDHGSGPAVLLSHGYGATSQMWQDQVAALKDRYRVIVWDLRGHGESDYLADPIFIQSSIQSRIWRLCSINAVLSVLSSAGIRLAAIRRLLSIAFIRIAVPR